ncbi:unnamed protein product [Echinostoma caproni]|uniref:Transposase n=1 Tax=Echinostoma caproni TaxID=27848 RepID=A0A183B5B8_9TREM|nr:unnamed protein product [Echinostoma caproni]
MNTEYLQAAAQTMFWSEANYETVESWELIRDNLLTLPPPCIPSWWSSRVKKALVRKRAARQRLCATGGYLRHLQYLRERKSFDRILLDAKRAFELSLAKKAKRYPKAYYGHI